MNNWTDNYGTQQQEKERRETFDFLVWVCKLGKTDPAANPWLLLLVVRLYFTLTTIHLIVVSTATVRVVVTASKGW